MYPKLKFTAFTIASKHKIHRSFTTCLKHHCSRWTLFMTRFNLFSNIFFSINYRAPCSDFQRSYKTFILWDSNQAPSVWAKAHKILFFIFLKSKFEKDYWIYYYCHNFDDKETFLWEESKPNSKWVLRRPEARKMPSNFDSTTKFV